MNYSNIDGIGFSQFNEILGELGYHDNEIYMMDDFEEIFSGNASEAIRAAFYGERFGFPRDQFNPNDEFFCFNGYANLVSIPEYYIQDYFDQFRDEILEYVNANEIELYGVEEEEEEYVYTSECGYLSELFK